ncbi:hypothetical protein JWG42_06365 [Desulfoprunum benzoelyticum]|uniref:Uncharacterized protein n=1 Tax=Desulfoprunum benzoelyticum TaxID=1506996 RepID=A0A840V041_9BACT|nr:hypothetical protein [Desulfoprunum benzoelyticum]MBB5347079.1 hypothetical protein [Desulfoprunum benzoelyticum]MBM9529773.1 hypothetical protein [Desulfoprunum benzoelyticum]
MSGSSRGLASLCSRISWWGYVLMAIISYAVVKHVAPGLAVAAGYAAMSGFFALLAPIITIGFLLLAAARLYDDGQGQVPPPGPEQAMKGEGSEDDAGPNPPGKQ